MISNIPNIFDAKSQYKNGLFVSDDNCYSKYSPAYITTNEPIRYEVSITPKLTNVLTVAGSGDQALFYKIAGAKHIDTFDISYCAHAIQDIKTTAIKNLSLLNYHRLLCNLHKTNDVTEIQEMLSILNQLSPGVRNFILELRGNYIFHNGINPFFSSDNFPDKSEYKKMRELVPQSFNFIWTDIMDLHTRLYKQYDIINLSNIFDYLTQESIVQTLKNLEKHLTIDGYFVIVCYNIFKKHPVLSKKHPHDDLKNFYIQEHFSGLSKIITLQKTK